jgi:hypothetical protein
MQWTKTSIGGWRNEQSKRGKQEFKGRTMSARLEPAEKPNRFKVSSAVDTLYRGWES